MGNQYRIDIDGGNDGMFLKLHGHSGRVLRTEEGVTGDKIDCKPSSGKSEFPRGSLYLLERGFGRKSTISKDIKVIKAYVFQRNYPFRTHYRFTHHRMSTGDFFKGFFGSSRLSDCLIFPTEDCKGTKTVSQNQKILGYNKSEVWDACFCSLLQNGLDLYRIEKSVSELQLVKCTTIFPKLHAMNAYQIHGKCRARTFDFNNDTSEVHHTCFLSVFYSQGAEISSTNVLVKVFLCSYTVSTRSCLLQ